MYESSPLSLTSPASAASDRHPPRQPPSRSQAPPCCPLRRSPRPSPAAAAALKLIQASISHSLTNPASVASDRHPPHQPPSRSQAPPCCPLRRSPRPSPAAAAALKLIQASISHSLTNPASVASDRHPPHQPPSRSLAPPCCPLRRSPRPSPAAAAALKLIQASISHSLTNPASVASDRHPPHQPPSRSLAPPRCPRRRSPPPSPAVAAWSRSPALPPPPVAPAAPSAAPPADPPPRNLREGGVGTGVGGRGGGKGWRK
ncbi:unnamed protein product [Closterium sp. NIES-53]